ncbi:restriction endonuclease subunit S [Microbacterium testaceum]|uniref:restriction endonuclease subunit S n=1 Tax=Microbacterium testaceum TaxID=2033 RepID=UPI002AC5477F|nr:restriction endonuclease subunit S [Microbacterium testaceum]MDZ5144151.1 restriction endonuclease subunit S [Microbacterium testaceum]
MSRIEELIEELCPRGVEFRPLGDCVLKNTGGGTPSRTRADFWDGAIPWASIGDITASDVSISSTRQTITEAGLRGSTTNVIPAGYVVVAVKIAPGAMRVVERDMAINQDLRGLRLGDELDPYFLSYYFKTINVGGNGTIVKGITNSTLEKIRVPVPPIEVQREIVRVLDQFAQLEAELEAELEARRRQYEYYRAGVFGFSAGDDVRWSTLGGVSAKVSSGGTPSSGRDAYYGGDIPWLRTQEVDFGPVYRTGMSITEEGLRSSSAKWIPEHCVIVAMYGATAAKVAINEIPLTTNQACCNLQIDPAQAEYRYVFYWIASQYERLKNLGEGSQSNLNARKVKDFPIPVPSLEEQRRIVSLLDKFDALVNDLSIGLPAELAARRKQYEYYRDKLLTFMEAA